MMVLGSGFSHIIPAPAGAQIFTCAKPSSLPDGG